MKYIFLSLILIPFLSSCEQDKMKEELKANHVLIVYLAADNDLSADALKNLEQIKKAYRSTGARLIVFIDTLDDLPRLLEVTENGSALIEEYREFNSVSAAKMNEVLQKIVNLYPAEQYGLVLWSHGTSWLPADSQLRVAGMGMQRAFGSDGGMQLNIPVLAEALPVKFDFILFDACLMGAVEVAYELRNKTDYIISPSTETIADGFPYELIIPELLIADFDLKKVAQTYFNFYNNQHGAYRSATISLVKTSDLELLATEMKKLFTNSNPDFLSFDRTSVQRLDVYEEQYHFDLLDFINKIFPDADVSAFEKQLEKCVLYKAHTPRFIEMFNINIYCGLSCYIRHSRRRDLNEYYKTLQWYYESGINKLF